MHLLYEKMMHLNLHVTPLFKGKEGTGVIFENYNRNDIISIVE